MVTVLVHFVVGDPEVAAYFDACYVAKHSLEPVGIAADLADLTTGQRQPNKLPSLEHTQHFVNSQHPYEDQHWED